MLKDFAKLETFLTVVKEKSFSKASAKLGISQPAVTQQIKFIEDYLDARIIDRKKNGVKLTKEGEKLLSVVNKLERCISNAEKEVIKIINKEMTFAIGSSFTIGNYILPEFLEEIKGMIKNEVFIKVGLSDDMIEELVDKRVDIAMIESPVFRDGIIYREWIEDELVLFSNVALPKFLKKDELYNFEWICREEGSHTRKLVSEMFEAIGVECNSFNVRGVVSSSTSVKQSILKSPKDKQTVSIISKHAIADEVASGLLFESRIKNFKLKRKLYIAYLKDKKYDAFVDNIVNFLMNIKK
ncbi:MAG: LysR family transcriptional regulator [Campylobacterales bacterium]|nr:LysR family transcriptional regulator [Campylobacterales bacterium]